MVDNKKAHTHEAYYKIVEVTSTSTSKETFASAQGMTAEETLDMLRQVKEMMNDE